ncbi:group II intron maturase-specific domain-containing protein [Rickettsiales endosymbiont of Trichoplax sp. H2]|uniref:group II intron maturase-specific domain-containing protein n=1 Tax=Rickettsiales endosymbiont of Trichoplax sp. H2 TaxID=2021221 RepID=UPI0012B2D456
MLVKHSKNSIKRFLNIIRNLIKSRKTVEAYQLIGELNPKISRWANYYKYVVSNRIFGYVDDCIYRCIAK